MRGLSLLQTRLILEAVEGATHGSCVWLLCGHRGEGAKPGRICSRFATLCREIAAVTVSSAKPLVK